MKYKKHRSSEGRKNQKFMKLSFFYLHVNFTSFLSFSVERPYDWPVALGRLATVCCVDTDTVGVTEGWGCGAPCWACWACCWACSVNWGLLGAGVCDPALYIWCCCPGWPPGPVPIRVAGWGDPTPDTPGPPGTIPPVETLGTAPPGPPCAVTALGGVWGRGFWDWLGMWLGGGWLYPWWPRCCGWKIREIEKKKMKNTKLRY